MKHVKVLIVAAMFTFVAAMVTMLFVGGANAQPTPPNAEDRGEARERRKDVRDMRKDDKTGTRTARVKLRGENLIERTTIRIDRLEKLTAKTADLARKMEQKGTDVSQALASFKTATEKISQARAALGEAQTILGQLENAEDQTTVINNFKSKMGETYKTLGEARQSIIQGIRSLKAAKSAGAAATN